MYICVCVLELELDLDHVRPCIYHIATPDPSITSACQMWQRLVLVHVFSRQASITSLRIVEWMQGHLQEGIPAQRYKPPSKVMELLQSAPRRTEWVFFHLVDWLSGETVATHSRYITGVKLKGPEIGSAAWFNNSTSLFFASKTSFLAARHTSWFHVYSHGPAFVCIIHRLLGMSWIDITSNSPYMHMWFP